MLPPAAAVGGALTAGAATVVTGNVGRGKGVGLGSGVGLGAAVAVAVGIAACVMPIMVDAAATAEAWTSAGSVVGAAWGPQPARKSADTHAMKRKDFTGYTPFC